jgi:pimeloyl-ACP methyl ester carboxylesterase
MIAVSKITNLSMQFHGGIVRVFILLVLALCVGKSHAQEDVFTYLDTLTVAEQNKILKKERTDFLPQKRLPSSYQWPSTVNATYEVELYRVSYQSSIPELNGKITRASGLVAIPKIDNTSKLPVISYQHGTVYGKYEVPSYAFHQHNPSGYSQYQGAYETRLMIAQYAGQGYVVMAADYFGMGDSNEPEAYMVKASSQQACLDLHHAVMKFLAKKGIEQTSLFLAGWSQGGLVTSAFLQALESRGVPVDGAFTAASPNDPFAAINGLIYHPREIDAFWSNSILALTAFSYEHYYRKPGLAAAVIQPEYYEPLRKIYQRDYKSEAELQDIFNSLAASRPAFKDYLRKQYHDPNAFADTDYGKLLSNAEAVRRLLKTPIRMYIGSEDEIIAQPVGQLGLHYQNSMGNQKVSIMVVEGGNHRGTFLTAVSSSLEWFNRLSQASAQTGK